MLCSCKMWLARWTRGSMHSHMHPPVRCTIRYCSTSACAVLIIWLPISWSGAILACWTLLLPFSYMSAAQKCRQLSEPLQRLCNQPCIFRTSLHLLACASSFIEATPVAALALQDTSKWQDNGSQVIAGSAAYVRCIACWSGSCS